MCTIGSVFCKQVHEVDLPFASELWRFRDAYGAVRVVDGAFLDFKEFHFHAALCGHVAAVAVLHQITAFAHPLEKPPLPHADAVLVQNLGEVAYEDGGL